MHKLIYIICFLWLLAVSPLPSQQDASQSAMSVVTASRCDDLNEFQKQTITSIREITLQLILIAVGVFAIMGGFVTSTDREFEYTKLLWFSFILLACS